jgi:predicted MFS family arabinose efflux permease
MRHDGLNDDEVFEVKISHYKKIYSLLFSFQEYYERPQWRMALFRAYASPGFRIGLNGLAALAVAMGIGRFAFTPQFPLMQADFGLSLSAGGWLASANYLGYFAGALLAGQRRVSAPALMKWGLWTVAVSTALMSLSWPLAWWLLMRFIAGVASAWVMVGTATAVLTRLARIQERRFDGLVFAGVGTGIALAGLICYGGAWSGLGPGALWLALSGLALAGTLIVLAGISPAAVHGGGARRTPLPPPRDTLPKEGSASFGRPDERAHAPAGPAPASGDPGNARWLTPCYGLFGFGYILPATYLPSQARVLLGAPASFGWGWPLFGAAAALSPLSIAWLARRPRKHTWARAQLGMAAGVSLSIVMPGLIGLAIAALCVGGTFMLITLLGLQEAREQAGAHVQKRLAAMTAAFAAGQLAGPVVANILLKLGWALDAALWLGAAALLISSVWLVFPFPQQPSVRDRCAGKSTRSIL